MKTASPKEFIICAIFVAIGFALFYLFDYFAKCYDKKHPNAPRVSGFYKTPKAGYNFSRGEYIFHLIFFFVVIPVLIICFGYVWELMR